MWDAADLAALINPDMPGYALGTKADLSTVDGLFRNGYAEAFGMVSGSNPRFYCAESTAPARNESLTVDLVVYTVAEIKPDKLGGVWLELEKQ